MEPDKDYYLGIDPGKSGAWAIIEDIGEVVAFGLYDKRSKLLSLDHLTALQGVRLACLEKVSAMPGQGVVSMFTFGTTYGVWQGILEAMKVPFELITPQKWQKTVLDFLPAERKERKEAITQYIIRRYPDLSTTLSVKKNQGIADAICLALYARSRANSFISPH